MSVLTFGDGDRRLLLVHGISSNAAGWWRLGPDLAAAGFAVTAVDLPGHGGSPRPASYGLAVYRDAVLAAGTAWDVVLGHSLGGLVTLACQLADPNWAGALILEDPALVWADTEDAHRWLLADYEGPTGEARVAAEHPDWAPGDAAAKAEALAQAGPDVVEGTLQALDGTDHRARLAELTVPTLVVGADPALGALFGPEDGAMAEALPGVDYVIVPGGGHSIHRNAYEPFLQVLLDWLGRVSPG